MKIAISTYSFRQWVINNGLTCLDIFAKAKELGFEYIEIVGLEGHSSNREDALEYAKKLRAEADRVGIQIVNFVFGCDLLSGTRKGDGDIEKEMQYVKNMIDAAEILGVKTIRHDVFFSLGKYASFDQALPVVAPRIREISEYARTKGIKTSTENHGHLCQDPLRMEKIFNAVACDNFGLLCDMGNFMCTDSDPEQAVAIVAPYTVYAHAKDFYFKSGSRLDSPADNQGFSVTRACNYIKGAPIGHGVVPVVQCLKILKKAGYDGYLTIEYEGTEECIRSIEIGKENLERYINMI